MTAPSGSASANSNVRGASDETFRRMTQEAQSPGYVALARTGELMRRAEAAWARLSRCDLCPRACGVDRLAGQVGYCRSGELPQVASHTSHPWEEPPISGTRGSGTIFFSNCTARCRFCQNYPISQLGTGQIISIERLAEMMLALQKQGCHNINFVTPTHYVPQILAALCVAVERGLRIPLLYNTSGYDQPSTLRLLDGVIDIYLPDAKYADEATARRVSDFQGYVRHNRLALLEMRRQVGAQLVLDEEGLARHGMIIRHMVLPEGLSQTPEVLQWLAQNIGTEVHLSLMSQYFPAHHAVMDPQLCRGLMPEEYDAALDAADALGFEHGWRQELDPEVWAERQD